VAKAKKIKAKIARFLATAKVFSKDPDAFTFKKLDYQWKTGEGNRIEILNAALKCYPQERYLEIGCFRNACFNRINATTKVGVDPNSGGTLRMTSDAYFDQFKDEFDVIFVDGLHTYEQSRKDAMNALKRVPVGGAVLFHDMLPLNWRSGRPERIAYRWNGDVWKTAVELAMGRGFSFSIILADHGVGIAIKTHETVEYADLYDRLKPANYRDFIGMMRILPLARYNDVLDALNRKALLDISHSPERHLAAL
jgi:hypothetical protein